MAGSDRELAAELVMDPQFSVTDKRPADKAGNEGGTAHSSVL